MGDDDATDDIGRPSTVGTDRDAERTAKTALTDRSVIVAGPLGSGKSHYLRAVGDLLTEWGAEHLVVQGSTALAGTDYGAIEAAGAGRLVEDIGGPAHSTDPTIVVVDDAHDLDEAGALLLARLVYRRRITLVAGLTMPRSSSASVGASGRALLDLWLRGEADRLDLHLLDEDTALDLVDTFDDDHLLGLVTRRALLFHASGSRALLRELTTECVAAKRSGIDPLRRIRELPPWSRVEATLDAEIAQYSPEECLVLAVLEALSGIGYADAQSVVRPGTLAALLDEGLVHADGTTGRRLYVSPLVARAAARRLPAGTLDEALSAAARGALRDWHPHRSARESINVVSHWEFVSERSSGAGARPVDGGESGASGASGALVRRLIIAAARDADRRGRYDLALAFVRLGDRWLSPAAAAVLRSRALVGARDESSAVDALVALDTDGVDAVAGTDQAGLGSAARRRVLRWAVALRNRSGSGDPRLRRFIDDLVASAPDDDALAAEVAVADAELSALRMDWPDAVERTRGVLENPAVATVTRIRAALVHALGSAYIGDWGRAEALFREVELGTRDPITGRTNDVATASWSLCFEALGRMAAGADTRPVADRLPAVVDAAVLEDHRAALCVLSMAAGSANWQAGAFTDAVADYAATALRCDLLELAMWRSVALCSHAIALHSARRHDEAMAVFARAELENRPHPMHDYVRHLAESILLPAEGDLATAATAASALLDVSSRGTPTLESRDRFMLATLTRTDTESAERMLALLDEADLPLPRALAEDVAARALDDEELVEQSRRHLLDVGAGWGEFAAALGVAPPPRAVGTAPPGQRRAARRPRLRVVGATQGDGAERFSEPAPTRGSVTAPATGPVPVRATALGEGTLADLTEREVEIAELVAHGLSNRQIAAELYLSVRTVESHIYQARVKLGAPSRRELGRLVSGEPA